MAVYSRKPSLYVSAFSFISLVLPLDALAELALPAQVDLRYDIREGNDDRAQYRLRFSPSWDFADTPWSLHGFVATGSSFSSSYNTLDDGEADYVQLRQAFVRYELDDGKIEAGVIPPYKGRVSSTGLAKDGWITGIRGVQQLQGIGAVELVVGEISNLDHPGVLQDSPKKLNYWEAEFSSVTINRFSYELAAERVLDDDFIRGEIRQEFNENTELRLEAINKLGDETKVVLGLTHQLTHVEQPTELFFYYASVPKGFGQRAELTEDFVDYGHSWVIESDSRITKQLSWFSKTEHTSGLWRFQLGVSFDYP